MDISTAAAYLRLGRRSLLRLLARENVQPLQLGLRLRRWRRADLDHLLERLPRSPGAADGPAGDDPLAALEAVARRTPRQGKPPLRASRDL
jgi:hypothetical protein